MYELLDQHRMFHSSCLNDFKNLKGLLDRFEVSTVEGCWRTSSSTNHWKEVESCTDYECFFCCDGVCGADSVCLIIAGSGEDCCLHEVKREVSSQQQDGQMGIQERVMLLCLREKNNRTLFTKVWVREKLICPFFYMQLTIWLFRSEAIYKTFFSSRGKKINLH